MEFLNDLYRMGLGLVVTAEVAGLVIVLSTLSGTLAGIALSFGPRPLVWLVRAYVDIVRGVPVLVLIFSVYYGVPRLGLDLNAFSAAVMALWLFFTAHVAEISRGALQSIPPGQTEAGKAIGLTFAKRMAYVILPQATRRFLPPWMNAVADMVKGTALVSLVGVVDLVLAMQQIVGRNFNPMPYYITGAVIYILVNYSLSLGSRTLEARFAYIRD